MSSTICSHSTNHVSDLLCCYCFLRFLNCLLSYLKLPVCVDFSFLWRTLCIHQWLHSCYRGSSYGDPETPPGAHRGDLHLGSSIRWPHTGVSFRALWYWSQSNLLVEFTKWHLQEGLVLNVLEKCWIFALRTALLLSINRGPFIIKIEKRENTISCDKTWLFIFAPPPTAF